MTRLEKIAALIECIAETEEAIADYKQIRMPAMVITEAEQMLRDAQYQLAKLEGRL